MRNKFNKRLKMPRIAKSLSNLTEKVNCNPNLSMFLEDIQLGIMPIGGESDWAPDFAVDIQVGPNDEPRVLEILESLPRRYQYGGYSWRNLEELLSDAVEKFALELVWAGCSVHKIFWDEKGEGVYRLQNFTYEWLFRAFGKCIWIIPKAVRHLYDKAYSVVPMKDIWDIVMPKELGGYRDYRGMLRNLARFPDVAPSFFVDQLSRQEWPANFDPQLHEPERALFVAKTTERWGWNQRDSNLENWNGFYDSYRILTLKWAQACLREHIIKELNQLLLRLQIDAEIVVKGLPTAWEILRIRKQMCEGKISLIKAFEKCLV